MEGEIAMGIVENVSETTAMSVFSDSIQKKSTMSLTMQQIPQLIQFTKSMLPMEKPWRK
jgi:glucokinase